MPHRKLSITDLVGRAAAPVAVVIYWQPPGGPSAVKNGHAALVIDGGRWLHGGDQYAALTDTDWYVSWMGGLIDWTPKLGSRGGNVGSPQRFLDDGARWGGQPSAVAGMVIPDRWVALTGLDTAAMHAAWIGARDKKGAHWHLTAKNCATMAHTVLKAGGGDAAAGGHKKQLVWWPSDLIKYARSMHGAVQVFDASGLTPAGQAAG